ncbi:MAG: ATP-binding protein [Gammaproteobacteria bacterium]|nr:ATP-binding protein [Rhodocyclaceae bacterium]MBU3909340.1 ATP-binding protein [Gammaproteobacteria bacterium]MBU3988712.1 ATP-binding protein [Gammaproteobacteria bacterium]MBU4005500.1 ATP-binding protein [Gammaproteobacteria bacterium]MBU4020947.1 ATP-binding protein [Gammaproteobacteria bacterium]
MQALETLMARLESLLGRAESLLPQPPAPPDWRATAFRWRTSPAGHRHGLLEPIRHPHRIRLDDLLGVAEQKAAIERNTRQFIAGRPANNVLLTGARGTGKSSLVKGVLTKFAKRGLRLIEVDRNDLVSLPEIIDLIADRPERFIVFCDDLSFEAAEPGYKALKSALDGSIAGPPENLLIYATSNRRHLMPERMAENLETTHTADGEIHPGETTEEKISLSERFGLWLSFYPFDQDLYLAICAHWLNTFGLDQKSALAGRPHWHQEALQWALQRGGRSGRVAWQFARDYAGRMSK